MLMLRGMASRTRARAPRLGRTIHDTAHISLGAPISHDLKALDKQCSVAGARLVSDSKSAVATALSAVQFGASNKVDIEYAERFSRIFERALQGNEDAFDAVADGWKDGGRFDALLEAGALSSSAVAEYLAADAARSSHLSSGTSLFHAQDPVRSTVLLCNCTSRPRFGSTSASDDNNLLHGEASSYVAVVRYDPLPRDEQRGLQPMWCTYTASMRDVHGLALLRWVHLAMQGSKDAPRHLPLRWALHDVNFALHGVPEGSEMLGVSKPMIDAAAPLALLVGAVCFIAGVFARAALVAPTSGSKKNKNTKRNRDGAKVLRDPWAEAACSK